MHKKSIFGHYKYIFILKNRRRVFWFRKKQNNWKLKGNWQQKNWKLVINRREIKKKFKVEC